MVGVGSGDVRPKEQRKVHARMLILGQLLAKGIFPFDKQLCLKLKKQILFRIGKKKAISTVWVYISTEPKVSLKVGLHN